MATDMRFLTLVILVSTAASAQSWSGYLVDARCYAAMERNHNPQSTLMDVNIDRDSEIRYCRPTAKSNAFSVVLRDGQSFSLDAAGNTKAAALPKGHILYVTVKGQMRNRTVTVNSITPTR